MVVRRPGRRRPTTSPRYNNLNSDPRAKISYNPLTFTVTLDYSNLPQIRDAVGPVCDCRGHPRHRRLPPASPTWSATRSMVTTRVPSRPARPTGTSARLHPEPGLPGRPGAGDHHVHDDLGDRHGHPGRPEHEHERSAVHRADLRAVPRLGLRRPGLPPVPVGCNPASRQLWRRRGRSRLLGHCRTTFRSPRPPPAPSR